jgi:hypothetical protein
MTVAYRTPPLTATISLANLGSSSSLTAGQVSAALNPTNKDDFASPVLRVVTGTVAPTLNTEIELWAFKRMPDGNWPDIFTVTYAGADAARTVVSREALQAAARMVGTVNVTAATNQPYVIEGRELGRLFDVVPEQFAFFVTHRTGQNLGASGHSLMVQQTNQV